MISLLPISGMRPWNVNSFSFPALCN
jgi:hypothetical protein